MSKYIHSVSSLKGKITGMANALKNDPELFRNAASDLRDAVQANVNAIPTDNPYQGGDNQLPIVTGTWKNQYGFGTSLVGESAAYLEYGTGVVGASTGYAGDMGDYDYNEFGHDYGIYWAFWSDKYEGVKHRSGDGGYVFTNGWQGYAPLLKAVQAFDVGKYSDDVKRAMVAVMKE